MFTIGIGNIIQTTGVELFISKLQRLTAHNTRKGADSICNRMSLKGIKKGVELSLSKSVIIVFTDAAPKDTELLAEINAAVTATHSQVCTASDRYYNKSSKAE